MITAFDARGSLEALADALDQVASHDDVGGILVLSCADNGFAPDALDEVLSSYALPVFGGLFPAILRGTEVLDRGSIVVGFPGAAKVQMVEGLGKDPDGLADLIDADAFGDARGGTVFVIVDGKSLHVNALLAAVFETVGLDVAYLGGGCGSLDFETRPVVFTNEGVRADAAVLAFVPVASGIGLAHGMSSVDGPFKVTEASGTTVKTIDWKPAAAFYREAVSGQPDHGTGKRSFVDTDAHFALGMNRLGSERVVVEPVAEHDGGALGFMVEMSEGDFVDLMHISEDDVVAAARTSRAAAEDALGASPTGFVTFDCVSRRMFLEERFAEELEALGDGSVDHVGALTFGGEVGTGGRHYLDYHNRTCVVGAFGE